MLCFFAFLRTPFLMLDLDLIFEMITVLLLSLGYLLLFSNSTSSTNGLLLTIFVLFIFEIIL